MWPLRDYLPIPARIVKVEPISELEKLYTLALPNDLSLAHDPGQFVQLTVFGVGEAPISITSSPSRSQGTFVLAIRKVGDLTNVIHRLGPGRIVGVRGPFGRGFPLARFHVTLLDGGTAGLEIANLLAGWTKVIILDAADFGARPGTVRCWLLDGALVAQYPVCPSALHSAGLHEALALAEALGTLPEHLTLVGIQPGSLEYDSSLSAEVRAALPAAVEAILEVLNTA